MKKILCIICCLSLVCSLFSCKGKDNAAVTSSVISAPSTTPVLNEMKDESSSDAAESADVQESDTVSNNNSQTSTTTSKVQSDAAVTTSKPKASQNSSDAKKESSSSKPKESKGETTSKQASSKGEDKNKSEKVFKYTVKDPENKRGLSKKKHGFSFGIAKDGKPHSQSVLNQKTFDSFKNVEALALDTKTKEKVMYLTFDNGYEYKNLTADILDTLKEKKVKAAFFITLSYAKQNKALVKRMIDEGHTVGNHSATHPSFPDISRKEMAKEIAELDNFLRKEFSYTSPYFRFPAGEYSENALELVTSIGFKSVFWSVAYTDWDTSKQNGKKFAFDTVTKRFHPGAVILLHAVSKDNAAALSDIIDKAKKEGYKFKTLDNYFSVTGLEPVIPYKN